MRLIVSWAPERPRHYRHRPLCAVLIACWIALLIARPSIAGIVPEDCEPKRPCDATRDCSLQVDNRDCSLKIDSRDCSLKVDTRDCEPHWACPDCEWYDAPCHAQKLGCEADKGRYKTQCEAAKSSQNSVYAGEKAACEAGKAAQNRAYEAEKLACETGKATQNAAYAAQKAACEGEKAGEKLDCERLKTQERVACELGIAGPYSCLAQDVVNALRTDQQNKLTNLAEWTGFVTTPAKALLQGWRSTACSASGMGKLYHEPVRSTDGFWTLDVELLKFEIDGIQKPEGARYVRLEVKPPLYGGGRAHAFFDSNSVTLGDVVAFEGPVYIDRDPPSWLEVHPADVLQKVALADVKATSTVFEQSVAPE